MRHTLIKDNLVINVIELNDPQDYALEDGVILGDGIGEIGDTWDAANNAYIKPEEPEKSQSELAQEELNALDQYLSRSLEDVITTLIDKNLVTLSDFGPVIETRYAKKANARAKIDEPIILEDV